MSAVARSAICRNVGSLGVLGGRRVFTPLRNVPSRPSWKIKEVDAPAKVTHSRILRFQSTVAESSTSSASSTQSTETSQSTPPSADNVKKSRPILRTLVFLSTTALCFVAGFTMAAQPTVAAGVDTARAVLNPPTDEETLTLFNPASEELAEIERQIFAHPLTRSLLQDEKYIASRPHLKIPEQLRAQNLTGGTLLGADKIAVPPLQFSTADGTTYYSLQYLGPALCGHPGIVHGGLLATLLDEGLARCCFPALPNKIAVTASLKVDYKRPCMAGQIVVLRAETTKVEGRKAWVTGRIETLADESKGEKPVVLTEAEALFIEPKGAENMKKIVPT
ncbi:Thioesterase/thiol ester dehydrase-isomerase [Aaosphaeria arxii CBS 175.79]|uniref:Thioesterase/thiol ester dehydrase-isomerase n=1 Tax=Aaosphaeria arxii CBS 175.79 TaxID=1450172 RepID=A0A6A5Y2B5_9PLEO|nr:Thioesterase/thiol ester dehydrase-isomerase [Aaosphaeria arxii CBS 175.79]KAF2018970.1 Thioesterase/thiol ester dehydrase-isomerase [Aaosphaeria arxii CBS 175.79]